MVMSTAGYEMVDVICFHNKPESTVFFLQITLKVAAARRAAAAEIYAKYKQPFLTTIAGARSKDLLVRPEDVQVLHGFESREAASAYLDSNLFVGDVVKGLTPLLDGEPDIRIYQVV